MKEGREELIMGGMFGLEEAPRCSTLPAFPGPEALAMVNARSCIRLLVETLRPRCVWLPSYLSPSLLEAVDPRRFTVRYYEMTGDLAIASADWVDAVIAGDLVIFIDYFGFPCDDSRFRCLRERGVLVLRDASQALLSNRPRQQTDFVVFSPRKLLGVVDGGVLVAPGAPEKLDEVREVPLESPPAGWWLTALNAAILRREFDRHGGDRRWFDLFQEAERTQPLGAFRMSELSMTLLRHGFDYDDIARRRRENYEGLLDRLEEIALFPELPPSVVPLGFPVRLENRAEVRRALFDHEIYPPVHWSLPAGVPRRFADSHRLAEQILTLPCDQRYDVDGMDSMARLVRTVAVSELA